MFQENVGGVFVFGLVVFFLGVSYACGWGSPPAWVRATAGPVLVLLGSFVCAMTLVLAR